MVQQASVEDKSDNGIDHPTYSVFWYFTLDDPNHVIFFAGLVQEVKVKSCP